MYANITQAENQNLSLPVSFDGPYPRGSGEEWLVYGASINDYDWSYRNDGNGTFYVFYVLPNGKERIINWEPADSEAQSLIPPPDDHEACARFAHTLIMDDDPQDWDEDEQERLLTN